MTQLQKYTWLIETIRRSGRISHKDLADRWQRNTDMSNGHPLHRATFNRWRDAIFNQFGIIISCQRVGGYLYYIENPEDIDEDALKKWMLDSFAVGNLIGENLALKGRIVLEEIPSGREHLTAVLEAMKNNSVIKITYHPFHKNRSYTFPIEPYCVKLFDGRWYVLAHNIDYDDMRLYSLDRIEAIETLDKSFELPRDFDAEEFFSTAYGIVIGNGCNPQRIVIRANEDHKHYLKSLPLHHSQKLIEDHGDYADFELYLAPTYDFIMRLLHSGAMLEVISPASLRLTMKNWIADMSALYEND